jgi:hypothetical protein
MAGGKDIVKSIAEQLGHTLSDECASLVSSDLEFRLREVVQVCVCLCSCCMLCKWHAHPCSCLQDAAKFMRHAKRQELLPDDINHAFRIRNTEVSRSARCSWRLRQNLCR